jgi:hypothetical protein
MTNEFTVTLATIIRRTGNDSPSGEAKNDKLLLKLLVEVTIMCYKREIRNPEASH